MALHSAEITPNAPAIAFIIKETGLIVRGGRDTPSSTLFNIHTSTLGSSSFRSIHRLPTARWLMPPITNLEPNMPTFESPSPVSSAVWLWWEVCSITGSRAFLDFTRDTEIGPNLKLNAFGIWQI